MSSNAQESDRTDHENHLSSGDQSENDADQDYESAGEENPSLTSVDALDGTTIHQLLSEEENQLLDTIDQLRSLGVGKLLGEEGLPQIIVCGDQSSGKSSVLEALTRVHFPTKSSVCTTFPTELRLRREAHTRFSCRIKPSFNRTEQEKKRIESKFGDITKPNWSADDIPALIEEARKVLTGDKDGS